MAHIYYFKEKKRNEDSYSAGILSIPKGPYCSPELLPVIGKIFQDSDQTFYEIVDIKFNAKMTSQITNSIDQIYDVYCDQL
ncbi:MAG: hypothetical protein M0R77_18460 [Gammaproteobacteria bacterium]|nr:hypothetical protein [Gammaproteobacteria bacterium]